MSLTNEPSAFVVEAHITWEEAVSTGLELRHLKDNSQWELGDLALKVETAYGTDAIGRFATDIGLNKKSLQQYRRVSQAFAPNQREELLSHRHHLILAAREDRLEWLTEAVDNNWSTMQLSRELALKEGRPLEEDKPPEAYRCSTCHRWRYETDEVCNCYKLRLRP